MSVGAVIIVLGPDLLVRSNRLRVHPNHGGESQEEVQVRACCVPLALFVARTFAH